MAIDKNKVIQLFDQLPESAQQSVYDFIQFLYVRQVQPDWDDIVKLEPDSIPLSEEEKRQLVGESDFMSWEEAMHELQLPTDTKP